MRRVAGMRRHVVKVCDGEGEIYTPPCSDLDCFVAVHASTAYIFPLTLHACPGPLSSVLVAKKKEVSTQPPPSHMATFCANEKCTSLGFDPQRLM